MWCSKIPPRVAIFSWTTTLGKILTIATYGIKVLMLGIGAVCAKEVGS